MVTCYEQAIGQRRAVGDHRATAALWFRKPLVVSRAIGLRLPF